MKRLQAALVIEGNSTSSILLRLPGFAEELGPIKSSGLQVARRVSNFLRAGYAVTSYSELATARTILIRVPDSAIDRVVAEIAEFGGNWSGRAFVLCETWAPTEKLGPLRSLGAEIASLVALPNARQRTFVVEGDLSAVRHVRRMIDRADAHSIELKSGAKHLFFAAAVLCTAVPVPLLLMAQQAMRESGVSGNHLLGSVDEMTRDMLSGVLKGARMTWGGALADVLKSNQGFYWDRLHDTHPELAEELSELVEWSRGYMNHKLSRAQTV